MYLLTIVFGPSPTPWALLFKDEELATQAYNSVAYARTNGMAATVKDEFGQQVTIHGDAIHGFMLEDLEKSKYAQIERGLHMARIQAQAQQRAQGDPILKNIRTTQGPAMIDPMGMANGGYR